MDRINEKFLVTFVGSELELEDTKIFTSYERARAYFMELLGQEMINAFNDSENANEYGAKNLATYYSELFDTLYFESGGGETLTKLPETFEEFKEDCNSYAAFGDFSFFLIKIMIVKEVS